MLDLGYPKGLQLIPYGYSFKLASSKEYYKSRNNRHARNFIEWNQFSKYNLYLNFYLLNQMQQTQNSISFPKWALQEKAQQNIQFHYGNKSGKK